MLDVSVAKEKRKKEKITTNIRTARLRLHQKVARRLLHDDKYSMGVDTRPQEIVVLTLMYRLTPASFTQCHYVETRSEMYQKFSRRCSIRDIHPTYHPH